MIEIMDDRFGKHSVEHVRYVINNLLHLVIVKYGVISLVLCISTRLRLVTILTTLVKYLVIFHANPCNKYRVALSKCGLCTHITLEFSVIPDAKPRDNRTRESYNERITHTSI